jgi:Amt family ammonium transporter
MNGSTILLAASAAFVAMLLAPSLALFFGGALGKRATLVLSAQCLGSFGLAFTAWLLLGSPVALALYQGALVCASVAIVAATARNRLSPRALGAFLPVWVVFVLVPLGFSLFDVVNGALVVRLGTLDFGGVAVLGISTGTAAIALAITTPGAAEQPPPNRSGPLLLFCGIAAVLGWGAVTVGAELVLDATTQTLLINELLAATAGLVGWLAAQVVNVHRASMAGSVAGIVAGSISILPASPWLEPTAVVVIALAAGILGHVVAAASRRLRAGQWAAVIGVCLTPAVFGMLASGIAAKGPGLVYSGHPDLFVSQFNGTAVALVYSLVVALVLGFVIERLGRLARPRMA